MESDIVWYLNNGEHILMDLYLNKPNTIFIMLSDNSFVLLDNLDSIPVRNIKTKFSNPIPLKGYGMPVIKANGESIYYPPLSSNTKKRVIKCLWDMGYQDKGRHKPKHIDTSWYYDKWKDILSFFEDDDPIPPDGILYKPHTKEEYDSDTSKLKEQEDHNAQNDFYTEIQSNSEIKSALVLQALDLKPFLFIEARRDKYWLMYLKAIFLWFESHSTIGLKNWIDINTAITDNLANSIKPI